MKYLKKLLSIPQRTTKGNLSTQSPWANFGCGGVFHSAWDNYDLTPAGTSVRKIDLSRKIPLNDGSYRAIYCSHVIEHVDRGCVGSILREFRRILQPGGILRLVVPDLALIVSTYLEEFQRAKRGEAEAEIRHEWMTLELLDQITRKFSGGYMLRWWQSRPVPARKFVLERVGQEAAPWILAATDSELSTEKSPEFSIYRSPKNPEKTERDVRTSGELHQWMYDEISLSRLLRETGFLQPLVRGPRESRIPGFSNYHLDTTPDALVRKPDSLFMEAVTPS